MIYEDWGATINSLDIETGIVTPLYRSSRIISKAPNTDIYVVSRLVDKYVDDRISLLTRIADDRADSLRMIRGVPSILPLLLSHGRVATTELDTVTQLVIRDSAEQVLKRFYFGISITSTYTPVNSEHFYFRGNGLSSNDLFRFRTDIGVIELIASDIDYEYHYVATSDGKRLIFRNDTGCVIADIAEETQTPISGTENVGAFDISHDDKALVLVEMPSDTNHFLRFMPMP